MSLCGFILKKEHFQAFKQISTPRVTFTDINNDGLIRPADDILESKTLYPFGMQAFGTRAAGHERSLEDFTGHDLTIEGYQGVHDMNARQYIPGLGIFSGVDPLADHPNQVDKSPYAYAWNNPTNLTDPDGKCPNCAVGAVVGGVIGFVGSVMNQTTSGDGQVDFGRASLDAGKGALAGAIIGSGAGLVVAAGEGAAALLVAGGVSAGGTIIAESAGELVEMGTVAIAPQTGIAEGGTIDPSFDVQGVATSSVIAGTAGMLGPVVEKAVGPVVRGSAGEATEQSMTKTITTTVESVTTTLSGYFNSWTQSDDGN